MDVDPISSNDYSYSVPSLISHDNGYDSSEDDFCISSFYVFHGISHCAIKSCDKNNSSNDVSSKSFHNQGITITKMIA